MGSHGKECHGVNRILEKYVNSTSRLFPAMVFVQDIRSSKSYIRFVDDVKVYCYLYS